MQTEQADNVQGLMEAGNFPAAAKLLAAQLAALDAYRTSQSDNTTDAKAAKNTSDTKRARIEALYLSAVCARYQNDHATARSFACRTQSWQQIPSGRHEAKHTSPVPRHMPC